MATRVPSRPDERCIDDYRPIKVICIGAGMSGIAVGSLFPQNIPNLELTIYEKNHDVGGTWLENHYPGLRPGKYHSGKDCAYCQTNQRSDLTPHVYQYTFASNPNWSKFYPPGAEFEEYLKAVAAKHGVYKNTKFGHKLVSARWFEDDGQWEVSVQKSDDSTVRLQSSSHLICPFFSKLYVR